MATEASYSSYESPSRSLAEEDDEESTESGPPPVPSLVAGRFRVKERIGSGSYSVVYRGTDREMHDKVAIKCEWVKAEKGRRLLPEARLYETFGKCKDVPQVRWYGRQGPYNIMVMDLQGASLDDRFSACGRKFSLKTVLLLAEQMIERIEFVHSHGIVHRDIKPHNFLMGMGEAQDRVLIMDFGLAKRYMDRISGKHIACTEHRGVTGTVRYASLNVHEGLEPSRRDDLEAIGFVLMHFLRGTLPWQGLKASSKRAKHEKIKRCKQKTSIDELCKGYPDEFAQYLKHCRSLQYAERPDYEYLRKLMRDCMARERLKRDGVFDWTEGASEVSTTADEQSGGGGGDDAGRRCGGGGDAGEDKSREARRRRPRSRSPDARKVGREEDRSKTRRLRRTHDHSPRDKKPRKKSRDAHSQARDKELRHRERRRAGGGDRRSGRS